LYKYYPYQSASFNQRKSVKIRINQQTNEKTLGSSQELCSCEGETINQQLHNKLYYLELQNVIQEKHQITSPVRSLAHSKRHSMNKCYFKNSYGLSNGASIK